MASDSKKRNRLILFVVLTLVGIDGPGKTVDVISRNALASGFRSRTSGETTGG